MKKLVVFFSLIVALTCFWSCKKGPEAPTIIDLNGDKVQEYWEDPFDVKADSERVLPEDVVVAEITTKEQLLNLGMKVSEKGPIPDAAEEGKEIIYLLKNDIDMGGAEVAGLDLYGRSFYGNNKIISNFKMTLATLPEPTSINDPYYKYSSLFMNSKNVFDLYIHLGYQTSLNFMIDNRGGNQDIDIYISPLFNCLNVENVTTRGYIKIQKTMESGNTYTNEKLISMVALSDLTKTDKKVVKKCESEGIVEIGEIMKSSEGMDITKASLSSADEIEIGGLVGRATNYDILDSKSNLVVKALSRSSYSIGAISGYVRDSFIENCEGLLKVEKEEYSNETPDAKKACFDMIGGAVGHLVNSEMKNVEVKEDSLISLVFASKAASKMEVFACVGGLVGNSQNSTISYSKSNVLISAENMAASIIGGAIGSDNNSVVRKIIVCGEISAKDCYINYISDFSGNTLQSFYEGCISSSNLSVSNSLYSVKDGENSINPSDITSSINVGMMFNASQFFNIALRKAKDENSQYSSIYSEAKALDCPKVNESGNIEISNAVVGPTVNYLFSESKFDINYDLITTEVDGQDPVITKTANVLYGGLFYNINALPDQKSLIYQNCYYYQDCFVKENKEDKISSLVNTGLIKRTATNYTFNKFKSGFYNEQLDILNCSDAEHFSVKNINFVFEEGKRGSIYRNYGSLEEFIKLSNVNLGDYLLQDKTSFIIDGIRKADSSANYYGDKNFYGIYKIGLSKEEAISFIDSGSLDSISETLLISKIMSDFVMFQRTDGNTQIVERRVYRLAEAENIKNQLGSEWTQVQGSSWSALGISTFVEAYAVKTLMEMDAGIEGQTRTIDYLRVKVYGNDSKDSSNPTKTKLNFEVVYPKVGEATQRIDVVEIKRICDLKSDSASEFKFGEDELVYLISTKIKTQ